MVYTFTNKNMSQKMILIIIGGWFLFMILAIFNAIIRDELYKPKVGDLIAHQISTIIFVTIIFIVTYFLLRISNLNLNDNEAVIIGSIWLVFTILFEFIVGHYIFGNSWDKLIEDYNILKGRIWILVLITTFFTPYITNKFLL